MTTPSILNNDLLIRKYRTDDSITGSYRQFLMKSDGKKYPAPPSFLFPFKYNENSDNSISVYVEDLLDRTNVPIELLVETITRPRAKPNPQIQYGIFKISYLEVIELFSDLVEVVYVADAGDPIKQRGLAHANITLKNLSEETYDSKWNDWAVKASLLVEKAHRIETETFRF